MSRFAILICATTLTTAASAVLADEEKPGGGDNAAAVQLQEVTITSERMTSTVQRTPLAITVLGGDELTRHGVNDVSELTGKVPNVNIANNNGTMTVNVRGVGTAYDNQSAEPAVNVNIDGVYLARAAAAVGGFFDIDRVEVLRGPQGTLYGRNSTGGSINIITNKPTQELQGRAELELGNYSQVRTFGMVNVPVVSGKLAVRAAFQTDRHDGYTNNAPATDYNDADNVATRLHALFTPTDNLSLLLSADYAKFGGVGPNHVRSPQALHTYDIPFDIDGRRDTPIYGYSAQLDWSLDPVTITYQGAYRYFHRDQILDSDSSYTADATRSPRQIWDWRNEAWSHELRAASDAAARLKWVAGGYFYKEHNNYRFTSYYFSPTTHFTHYNNPIAGGESYALFGQATYKLTDNLGITGGIRYTEDTKHETGQTQISFANGTQRFVTNSADLGWSNVSGRVGLEWDVGGSSLVYANVSNGYKAGGFYDGINNRYDPEDLTAYEAGWKRRFFDSTLQVNAAAFYYDYKDFQAVYVAIVQGAGVPATANAKKARTAGGEIESVYLFRPGSRLSFNVSYLDAKFIDFILPSTVPQNYSGFSMPRSPRWSVDAGYGHTFSLANGGALIWDLRTHYQDGTWLMFQHSPNSFQSAYTRTDTNVTFESPDQRWSVSAYVRNLEGDPVATNAVAGAGGSILVDLLPPRTFGVRFGVKL